MTSTGNPAATPPGFTQMISSLDVILQQGNQSLFAQPLAEIEGAKLPEPGAYFIKSHLRNNLFKGDGILRKQGNPPFPIVEADGTGDDLTNPARIGAADHSVALHHSPPLFHREHVPVVAQVPSLVHGVETDIFRLRQARLKPLPESGIA